jgi:hypothetical protein
VAIDIDSDEGKVFYRLARELHERRVGREGNVLWTRTTSKNLRVRPGLELLYDYWQGNPPLSSVQKAMADHVREFIRIGRLNIAGLLVSSPGARLEITGFHTAHADDEQGDAVSARLMRATEYKLMARDLHDFAFSMGDGYSIVTPPKSPGEGLPYATAEDPRQVITAHDPVTNRARYALKVYRDDWDEADFAYVFFPDGVVRRAIVKGRTSITEGPFRADLDRWNWDTSYGDNGFETMPEGRFPVVRFRNRHGIGEFEQHLDSLDRINDKITNEWFTSKMQAFRQRAVKGLPDKDEDGNDADYDGLFTASPDEMWQVPDGVEFWESQPIDMGPIVSAIQKDLERLAAVTSQPLHTITPDAANGSAEGAALMREEHVYKVQDRRDRLTPSHAEVMGLLMTFGGHAHGDHDERSTIDPIWGPLERYSIATKASAAAQLDGKYPLEAIWTEVMQEPHERIPLLRQQMARQRLYAPAPAGQGQQGTPPTGPRPVPQPEPGEGAA